MSSRSRWGLPLLPVALVLLSVLIGCTGGDYTIRPVLDESGQPNIIYLDGAMDYCNRNWENDPNCWEHGQ